MAFVHVQLPSGEGLAADSGWNFTDLGNGKLYSQTVKESFIEAVRHHYEKHGAAWSSEAPDSSTYTGEVRFDPAVMDEFIVEMQNLVNGSYPEVTLKGAESGYYHVLTPTSYEKKGDMNSTQEFFFSPTIDTQPQNESVTEGDPASFSVSASSPDGADLFYEWEEDAGSGWVPSTWTGADTDTITKAATDLADDGLQVRVWVYNYEAGSDYSVMSDVATLTVAAAAP